MSPGSKGPLKLMFGIREILLRFGGRCGRPLMTGRMTAVKRKGRYLEGGEGRFEERRCYSLYWSCDPHPEKYAPE